MTNYERIKEMTPEEMAIMFFYTDCQRICAFTKNGRCNSFTDDEPCVKGVELWLNSEAKENG